ncbi:hypothetical protein G7K_0516-t1 [Saitoella complicata NRRL Y-17804]|uniref:Uncharacterized protein n=1 Tax=Saitoella complicata (strain BCRC 22490 / CBS 7301 / JCM 7358 / NBRC 10748 / NRRL Y-17804) TaxID=698492 RepID=A0A0E9N8Z8_SAICN|nr:hypothetical protein G7K_0516-t1 [Saitoella complicata NRRL Y-17804]
MPGFDSSDFLDGGVIISPPADEHQFGNINIPGGTGDDNVVEVPASRSSLADSTSRMHSLSISPSFRDRRRSRNSFGASLPIPRRSIDPSNKQALSHRDSLAAQVQSLAQQRKDDQARDEKMEKLKNMAFVFDIDGVLVHGDRFIPEGRKVLRILNGENELGVKIPHVFVTNGSGKPEDARCEQLSNILEAPISTHQFIQAHTPMRALAEFYNTVLVVGGEGYRCREVAELYGFKDIVVPNDIVAWDPTLAPFRVFTDEERKTSRPRDFSKINIEAIMVFSDSRDYATDLQIIMDLLQSENGRLGTMAKDPVSSRIPIYFSHGDLLCPSEHWKPRMSQGTFRLALEAMYHAITGVELERVIYGKPEAATYKFADTVLQEWLEEIHGEYRLPENVYMIGDNPQSDICGANGYGWNSCLVKTGVHQGDDNDKENPASEGVFENVFFAVKHALEKQLGKGFGLVGPQDGGKVDVMEARRPSLTDTPVVPESAIEG